MGERPFSRCGTLADSRCAGERGGCFQLKASGVIGERKTDIKFTEHEKAIIVRKIQRYFTEELRQEIGRFDAEFLLDFFSREIGSCFYSRGLYDARARLSSKLDDLAEAICALERPIEFRNDVGAYAM